MDGFRAVATFVIAPVLMMGLKSARSQEAGARKAANELFFQGKALSKEGKTAAACAKFEESLARLAQLGVKMNLADCYERLGRTATAVRLFEEVAIAAEAVHDERKMAYARQHAADLSPGLPHVALRAPALARVELDGVVLSPPIVAPVAVDPGRHELVAAVPGAETFRRQFHAVEGETVTIEVPPESAPTPAAPAAHPLAVTPPTRNHPVPPPAPLQSEATPVSPPNDAPTPGSGRRTVAFVVGSIGAAALGVTVVTSVLAVSRKNDAGCSDDGHCPSLAAADKLSTAHSFGSVATATAIVGLAAVGAGVVLYLTAPKSEPVSTVSLGPASFLIQGRF